MVNERLPQLTFQPLPVKVFPDSAILWRAMHAFFFGAIYAKATAASDDTGRLGDQSEA
jgi:hypothetical protein